jgi:DNA-directed RNA polymerase omega subunit
MDLISLPTELDRKKIDSRYRLVEAVAERARALYHGAMPKITSKAKKMTTVALEEVISGSVRVLSGEAALKAKEEAGKLSYQDMMDETKQKESLPEELTRLEKELKVYLRDKKEVVDENAA